VLADVPRYVEENLFLSKDCHPLGVYQVQLFRDGAWVVVTVDDLLPVRNF